MSLTTEQQQVLAELAAGSTQVAAAAATGIHRNTIAYWRQNSPHFRTALTQCLYDRALFMREKAEPFVDSALETISSIMLDPAASPTARLEAAVILLDKAWAPLPQEPKVFLEPDCAQPPPAHPQSPAADPPQPQETAPVTAPRLATVHQMQRPSTVHSFVQTPVTTIRRAGPEIGRNELCPCHSGLKFKRCCIDKPAAKAYLNDAVAA